LKVRDIVPHLVDLRLKILLTLLELADAVVRRRRCRVSVLLIVLCEEVACARKHHSQCDSKKSCFHSSAFQFSTELVARIFNGSRTEKGELAAEHIALSNNAFEASPWRILTGTCRKRTAPIFH
jgi:hypothetical protein